MDNYLQSIVYICKNNQEAGCTETVLVAGFGAVDF
jgi:hypothetical protein